ncbi:undecaprenyl-diphosphate phosphatase [Cerasicoccus fimbriatus]|uniref:undecaprenyl-diphosphate phosphatase n=1 Tax=Cerasicoccus fimbriatus TaxID=3014554 RepID=UPI0022B49C3C|nr:undecaprenyl-diphosphate phosphatase [Cerasicoccus sp. TK19100]
MIKNLPLILLLLIGAPLFAQDAPAAPTETLAKSEISYTDALILGVVEGITEYLPISSTGHLILTNAVLGLDTDTVLTDDNGKPIETEDGLLTLKDVANAYAIIIQAGAIAAVIMLYWSRLVDMLMGVLGKSKSGLLLLRNILTAFMPAVVLGLLLDDFIESKLFHPIPIAIALIAGAFLMLGVECWRKKQPPSPEDAGHDLHEITMRQSLIVGFLQCVAMWPGTSRSMMTIVGGYVIGLTPKRAAEFSFLLGLITLSAASAYKALTLGPVMMKAIDPGPALFGIVVAWISAMLAVKWLVNYLSKHGLGLFAWYRIVLAIVVLAFFL